MPEAVAVAAPVPAARPSIGQRFFPSAANSKAPKIAGLTAHFAEVPMETTREAAARLREERAAAKAAKEKEEKSKAKPAAKARRNTTDLRVKVGNAPMNPVFGDDFDAFHDPYMLMPVEDPHDDNVCGICSELTVSLPPSQPARSLRFMPSPLLWPQASRPRRCFADLALTAPLSHTVYIPSRYCLFTFRPWKSSRRA